MKAPCMGKYGQLLVRVDQTDSVVVGDRQGMVGIDKQGIVDSKMANIMHQCGNHHRELLEWRETTTITRS